MNIFILDWDFAKNAEYHCDKHIVKMPLELAQLLCTAHRVSDGNMVIEKTKNNRSIKRWNHTKGDILYKSTHVNHPCAVWVRENSRNYHFTYNLFLHLCKEYSYRFGRNHLSEIKLSVILDDPPLNIPISDSISNPPLAMPENCKIGDAVESYRKYYIEEKSHLFKWTKRIEPFFI